MKRIKIESIFRQFAANNPAPHTELTYTNSFTFLVAVILSAQATDVGVNKATKSLFEVADSPDLMLKLGEEGLKKYIKTIGLYNAKAKNIIAMCQMLLDDFGGTLPRTREELETLPGVGRKTANVVLNTLYGEHRIAVDTHVFRVSNRIGLVHEPNELKTELALEKVVPEQWKQHAHHWLILHGRYVCKARKPQCGNCLIRDLCEYEDKNLLT